MRKSYTYGYASSIANGQPLQVTTEPSHGKEPNIKRDDPEEAQICLTCTKKKCGGGEKCFAHRKKMLESHESG